MSDVEKLFRHTDNVFTVFVVEQRFVVNKGWEYFRSYQNTKNFFDSDEKVRKRFRKIIEVMEKGVAPVANLIGMFAMPIRTLSIAEIITSLSKLFSVTERQVAGPEVMDPIILQEGDVTKKTITKLIHLHKDSIIRPSIIILLKDNDFERAKKILAECPHGINIKMIRNSGEEEVHKVINCGAEDIDSFISSFAEQCYSTCSKTKKEILLNTAWSENTIVSEFAPQLLKIRTNLLFDEKEEIRNDLNVLVDELISKGQNLSERDERLIQSLVFTAKLYRVFCNDSGSSDIIEAERLATSLNNELLLAQVYRYAYFLPNCTEERRRELYEAGHAIFRRNGMEDHAIYCTNNKLIRQFYSEKIFPEEFRAMQVEAVNNVPGLVAMSHIYNNVGVAYLYCGQASVAIDFFNKGLDYALYQDRIVQNLAIESNKMIAECYSYATIDENRLRLLMRRIFDGMGIEKMPFLSADYVLNILSVANKQNPRLGDELINTFPVKKLINASFARNYMGSAERLLQIRYLALKFPQFQALVDSCSIPNIKVAAEGRRAEFIAQYGLSPFDFATWL